MKDIINSTPTSIVERQYLLKTSGDIGIHYKNDTIIVLIKD